jgi:hypothetical protein
MSQAGEPGTAPGPGHTSGGAHGGHQGVEPALRSRVEVHLEQLTDATTLLCAPRHKQHDQPHLRTALLMSVHGNAMIMSDMQLARHEAVCTHHCRCKRKRYAAMGIVYSVCKRKGHLLNSKRSDLKLCKYPGLIPGISDTIQTDIPQQGYGCLNEDWQQMAAKITDAIQCVLNHHISRVAETGARIRKAPCKISAPHDTGLQRSSTATICGSCNYTQRPPQSAALCLPLSPALAQCL